MSSIESQFLESSDFSKYEGEWVAILDKKVVAHGKTLDEVYDKIMSLSLVRTPLFHRIPKKDEIDTFIL
ncbi:MAG: DUF5678 domain-containing protein [Nitrosotalea sp.]